MGVSLSAQLERAIVSVGWTTNIAPRWSFDLDAITRACELLGVRERVVVGCAEYPNGRWGGMYTWDERLGGQHKVCIVRAATAERASRLLWHELTHAAQYERGDDTDTRRLARRDYSAYRSHPAEVEARRNESNHLMYPLTRASG